MGFSIGSFFSGVSSLLSSTGLAKSSPAAALLTVGAGAVGAAFGGNGNGRAPGRALPAPVAISTSVVPQAPAQRQLVSLAGPAISRGLGALGVGAGVMSLFNGDKKNRLSLILASARENTGGSVTRNNVIDAAKVCGIDTAASTFGISTNDVCFVVIKGRTRRRRGISAADIRRTRRVINFNKKLTKDLRVRK